MAAAIDAFQKNAQNFANQARANFEQIQNSIQNSFKNVAASAAYASSASTNFMNNQWIKCCKHDF